MSNNGNRGFLLDNNKDWDAFVNQVSENTGNRFMKDWMENAKENKPKVEQCGWAAEDYLDTGIGKTAVLIGASPALQSQVDTLKTLQKDPDFVLIAVSTVLEFLLDNGVTPAMTTVAEADPIICKYFKNIGEKAQDITLLASVCAVPKVIDSWQGKKTFVALYTSDKKLNKQLEELYSPVNGCGIMFPALCSQMNTAVAFAYRVLGCRVLIFVGNELSFPKEEGETYYVDRTDHKDNWKRKPHIDIYGKVAYTTFAFMTLKLALEDYLQRLFLEGVYAEGKMPFFFNATEAGIFGVSKRYGNLSIQDSHGNTAMVVWQMRLPMALAHARSIMRTGNPITITPNIKKPSTMERILYS